MHCSTSLSSSYVHEILSLNIAGMHCTTLLPTLTCASKRNLAITTTKIMHVELKKNLKRLYFVLALVHLRDAR